jgi:hypothetical protein
VNRHPDIVAQAIALLVRICVAIMPVLRGLRVELVDQHFPSSFVAPADRASHHSGPGVSSRTLIIALKVEHDQFTPCLCKSAVFKGMRR